MNLLENLKEQVTSESDEHKGERAAEVPAKVAAQALGSFLEQAVRRAQAGTTGKAPAREASLHSQRHT